MIGVLALYLTIYVGWMFFWGWVSGKIACNKGYQRKDGFWWGFFLGFIGMIVVLTKPDKHLISKLNYEYNDKPKAETATSIVRPGSWQCKECGRWNTSSMCSCGTIRSAGIQKAIINNAWICPKCRTANPNFVGTCGCGTEKPIKKPLGRNNNEG